MKTPYDLFATFAELGNTARQNIVDLMKSHGVKSLNTNVYMYEYDYDLVYVSVYNIKMDCVFYEPIAMITLDEQDKIHIYGEESGGCYEPMPTDWLNIYSLVYDIFNDVDNGEIELFGDSGNSLSADQKQLKTINYEKDYNTEKIKEASYRVIEYSLLLSTGSEDCSILFLSSYRRWNEKTSDDSGAVVSYIW